MPEETSQYAEGEWRAMNAKEKKSESEMESLAYNECRGKEANEHRGKEVGSGEVWNSTRRRLAA